MAPPPFDPPKTHDGRRTAGHVQVPDPTSDTAGPLEMSWKVATAGALVEPSPTKLRRTSSIAGNVLVTGTGEDGSRRAYWLQRKITEETHTHNFVRIGFPLQPFKMEGGEESNTAWTVCKASEGSMYPFEMVAIKVQGHNYVYPEEADDDDDESGSDGDGHSKADRERMAKSAKNEISALQLIQAADPNGKGNVLRAEEVVDDLVHVYVVMPYCKEGTLMDQVGASPSGRLEESVARKYFCNLVNVRLFCMPTIRHLCVSFS